LLGWSEKDLREEQNHISLNGVKPEEEVDRCPAIRRKGSDQGNKGACDQKKKNADQPKPLSCSEAQLFQNEEVKRGSWRVQKSRNAAYRGELGPSIESEKKKERGGSR